jgi:hypothetical protein
MFQSPREEQKSQTVLVYETKMRFMEDVNNNRTKAQRKREQAEDHAIISTMRIEICQRSRMQKLRRRMQKLRRRMQKLQRGSAGAEGQSDIKGAPSWWKDESKRVRGIVLVPWRPYT